MVLNSPALNTEDKNKVIRFTCAVAPGTIEPNFSSFLPGKKSNAEQKSRAYRTARIRPFTTNCSFGNEKATEKSNLVIFLKRRQTRTPGQKKNVALTAFSTPCTTQGDVAAQIAMEPHQRCIISLSTKLPNAIAFTG